MTCPKFHNGKCLQLRDYGLESAVAGQICPQCMARQQIVGIGPAAAEVAILMLPTILSFIRIMDNVNIDGYLKIFEAAKSHPLRNGLMDEFLTQLAKNEHITEPQLKDIYDRFAKIA